MSTGLVDTTVIVHYLRKNALARAWIAQQTEHLSLTSVTWLEVISGATSKAHREVCREILSKFKLIYLIPSDQKWAMEQFERYQFSHHIGVNDCQIASVVHRLQIPLYTHNLKDMTPLVDTLAQKPY